MIDTASRYENEAEVGEAERKSGIPREEIFLATKMWPTEMGYEETKEAFARSVNKLRTDYIDLYLIHWPRLNPQDMQWRQKIRDTWRAMEELYEAGKIRAIGISNFRPHHIEALLKTAKIAPMVNQIRLCPGETQDELVAYCKERNILLEAYSPLGTGQILKVPEMQALAEKYQKSIAQICIRWSLQMGFLPLPKSVTAERIRENMDVFGFELSEDDVKLIVGLTGCVGLSKDPDTTNW